MQKPGKFYGVGVGPGDPELITLKALNIIKRSKFIAFHQTKTANSQAMKAIRPWLERSQTLIPLTYPITKEYDRQSEDYKTALEAFYQETTNHLAEHLDKGNDICLIVEGDPVIYSSFAPLFMRLHERYPIEIIPGISSFSAAASIAQTPLCNKDQSLTLLPATLPEEELLQKLNKNDGFVIFKIGQHAKKIVRVLKQFEIARKAYYIEYASQPGQKIFPIEEIQDRDTAYFSLIVVPPQECL